MYLQRFGLIERYVLFVWLFEWTSVAKMCCFLSAHCSRVNCRSKSFPKNLVALWQRCRSWCSSSVSIWAVPAGQAADLPLDKRHHKLWEWFGVKCLQLGQPGLAVLWSLGAGWQRPALCYVPVSVMYKIWSQIYVLLLFYIRENLSLWSTYLHQKIMKCVSFKLHHLLS